MKYVKYKYETDIYKQSYWSEQPSLMKIASNWKTKVISNISSRWALTWIFCVKLQWNRIIKKFLHLFYLVLTLSFPEQIYLAMLKLIWDSIHRKCRFYGLESKL